MSVRNTSIAAYLENEDLGISASNSLKIFVFIKNNLGCSRNDIERALSMRISTVSGRVSGLLDRDLIHEEGCKHDPITGKSVNRLYIGCKVEQAA